jgi:predicted nucleic acid-binding protein
LLVIDASVAVKFVAAEPGQAEALDRVFSEPTLVAPDWLLIEASHALWRKVKLGELTRDLATESIVALPQFFEELVATPELVPAAVKLAFELDHWIYDCIYLAAAVATEGRLLTADRKFWNAASRAGHGERIELLTWEGQAQ